jgi:DNA recombination protein RmuC
VEQAQTVTSTRLDGLDSRSSQLNTLVDSRLAQFSTDNDKLTKTVEGKLSEIRTDNEKRLEQLRQTVEEKLQTTLENRLSTSFKQVGDQLESVYKQLGEMQTLAQGVGNLEKVLTNVKARGMWGELQAERILQEILLPDQYLKNVVTKRNSRDPVEFAVRLPGAAEGEHVLLPIDSKFPREDYERLCDATQASDVELVKTLRKALERRILDEAKDIREKYIDVPNTTDFAILFLPIEGLYAEILSIPGLQERVQHEFHVMISGPATLASLLNSLQMGFRTLAIEKKSSEVWHVLGEVKTEYGKFGVVLEAIKKKLVYATTEIDNAFTRHRAMGRKLREVEAVETDSEDIPLIEEDEQ